jgi:hypothetical protein
LRAADESGSLSIPDLKRALDRTVLLGDPGSGKTTAAKFLVNDFAGDPKGKIPFLVTLREYAAKTPLEWSVAGYIEATLTSLYQAPAPDGLIERLLLTGTTVPVCYMASSFLPSAGYGGWAAALRRAW